jgi:monothiol glutaredoxin
MSLDPALRSRIESILGANRVVLFMKGQPTMPQCGFSAKAVGALQDLGVEFAHVNVLADQEIREGIKAYGDWPTIPQLYVGGELVGGSDIILQMANSGELSSLLGVAAPDRTPPTITVTPAAVEMLKGALADAPGSALQLSIDARFQPNFQLAPFDANAIAAESNGLRVQFDVSSARRANGITIDWVDDIRGQGLAINNPNAPRPVQELDVRSADDQLRAGAITLVDVRPADERAIAAINAPFETFDGDHRGGRSAQAADHFHGLGFSNVFNVTGGIDAWSENVDNSVPKY